MSLLVTRPQPQADDWVQRLRQQGVDALALPLIAIAPVADAGALRAAWAALAGQRLVVFVSPNAVLSFFAARPAGTAWPASTLAGSTGPGTTQALRGAGVTPAQIVEPAPNAATFDSEALWQQLAPREWHGALVQVVRGEGGRDWLADQLSACGAAVSFVEAYRRDVPSLSAAQRALLHGALAAPQQSVWLFSSSQAVGNLGQLAPAADWSRASAWASHPRIAQAAQAAGFGAVHTVSPTVAALAAAWKRSIQSNATSAQRP